MLEVIKHFFSVDKLVFVVATDTDQLSHSIKAVYGEGFDADTYLRRFFQQRAKLPEPDFEQYISAKVLEENLTMGDINVLTGFSWGVFVEFFACLATNAKVSIRDVDQVIFMIEAVARQRAGHKKYALIVLVVLIFQFYFGKSWPDESIKIHDFNSFIHFGRLRNNLEENCAKAILAFFLTDSTKQGDSRLKSGLSTALSKTGLPIAYQEQAKNSIGCMVDWVERFQAERGNIHDFFWRWSDYKKMIELSDALTF
jgi:hypothetical protein